MPLTGPSLADTFSELTKSGKEPMPELVKQIYADFNAEYGTDVKPPGGK